MDPAYAYALPARLSYTYAAGGIVDPDGIKTSIATAVTAQNYTTFNGAEGAAGKSRLCTVTSSANVGSYVVGSTITFTGTDNFGTVITDALALTDADGGETITGTVAFATITAIDVEAQADTGGAFTFGNGDAVFDSGECKGVRGGAIGVVDLRYPGGVADLHPTIAGEVIRAFPVRIVGATTTANQVTAYL